MTLNDIEKFIWRSTLQILNPSVKIPFPSDPLPQNAVWQIPPGKIRFTRQQEGQPGFKIDDNVIFLEITERDDNYAKQLDTSYKYDAEKDTVFKISSRTIVYQVQYIAYGPESNTNINKLKDGVFREDVKRLLSGGFVFLIPNLLQCAQVHTNFAGRWWQRWDWNCHFNHTHYLPVEDVGIIEQMEIITKNGG